MNYEEEEREFNLLEYWRVITKRKRVLFIFASVVIVLVGIYSFTATSKYKAKASLLIEEESSKILSIEDEFGYRAPMRDLRFFNTQLILLESESLAERVVRKMNLISRPEFVGDKVAKKNLIAKAKDILTLKWISLKKKEKENAHVLTDPYVKVAGVIRGNMEISPIRDTKVIELSYTSPHPVLAAEVVNTLAEEFITFSIEKRYEATQKVSDFLSDQIVSLREDLAAKEQELQKYGQEKELFFLSDEESTAVSKFADLNTAYIQAQIERVKAESEYREVKGLNVESIPQSVNDPAIQQLRAEYTRLKNEYEEKSKIYKPDYPEMIKLKAKTDSMKVELRKVVDTAESEYRAARERENSLKRLLEKQKEDVAQMNSSAILYNSLKIEVENKRKLLDSLVERQNETMVSARLGGLKSSNISIIDKAKVPRSTVSPKKKRNLILALLVGIFGGIGLCFLIEKMDNTIKGPEDVEKLVELPSMGIIPFLSPGGAKKKKGLGHFGKYKYSGAGNPGGEGGLTDIKDIELVNHFYPQFSISEDYRTVRTSIMLSRADNPSKSFAFSSTLPMEGKTATVANLAVAFAQLRKKVLIVDTDLRKPRLHRLFKVRSVSGLTGYLSGNVSIEDIILKTNIENLSIIPSGIIPPNPAELLDSNKMKELMEELKKRFDVVLLDTPPVLAVADSLIISSLVDSVILIVEPEQTKNKPFLKAVEQLRQNKSDIMGVMFNKAKVRKGDYYYKEYYYHYRHDQGGEEKRAEA